jgi:hypothetical protein
VAVVDGALELDAIGVVGGVAAGDVVPPALELGDESSPEQAPATNASIPPTAQIRARARLRSACIATFPLDLPDSTLSALAHS